MCEYVLTTSRYEPLQFDRVTGNLSAPTSILYADVTSPTFGHFHQVLSQTASSGKTSYVLRHTRPAVSSAKPFTVGGYGAELALKRTDYIVIDDRDADASSKAASDAATEVILTDKEVVGDLKPLSKAELAGLGIRASSFILESENPFQMFARLSQDFPRYSSAIAAHNASPDFVLEHQYNRGQLVPAGVNVVWVNGMQIPDRRIDAYNVLDILRKERKVIREFSELGLSGPQTIDLLSSEKIAEAQAADEAPRFDWRDTHEGGNTIIWLNDIEKDKRYDEWPKSLTRLLQRTYPGQLPQVRRDIFNLVLSVNLANRRDQQVVIEQLSDFVKRKLPLRFGLVPLTPTDASVHEAKVAYYLFENYGISTVVAYLKAQYVTNGKLSAAEASFYSAISDRKIHADKTVYTLEEALDLPEVISHIEASRNWVKRLKADTPIPPLFVNGVVIARDQSWMQPMSQQINADVQLMQRAVYTQQVTDKDWLPQFYLETASVNRNPLVIPEDDAELQLFDLSALYATHMQALDELPTLPAAVQTQPKDWAQLLVIADVKSDSGKSLLDSVLQFRKTYPEVELILLPTSISADGLSSTHKYMQTKPSHASFEGLGDFRNFVRKAAGSNMDEDQTDDLVYLSQKWSSINSLLAALGMKPGQQGLLINGRLIRLLQGNDTVSTEDLNLLLQYERSKRINPVVEALQELDLLKLLDTPSALARITSMVFKSFVSDVPEGIYEQAPALRIDAFNVWKSEHSAIAVGDASTASIRIVATVDPASQASQRLIPILKVLSELDGVSLKLYLNPKDHLSEIPIKRFYRYVLDSKPSFDANGDLREIGAHFASVPQEALLTVGMDVPAPWLVAPKETIHDLDNIKLSSVTGDVTVSYELENILIEGHSHDNTNNQAPRGAQLVLGTERDPHAADTIIMANLGYFQFKAHPGHYKISLQDGRSSDIFQIDSLQNSGKDTSTHVALMSFQGVTLYPQLSRKAGQETEDVLEPKAPSKADFLTKARQKAERALGLTNKVAEVKHTDINIFSVASGHLYERMLNIMMISVMKHTTHTVKFWFIEQFLSPSFKADIPALAAEYGFQYEMVTYKWPHWLRGQTEKQREIWGYKILFLDVLFPLSLDKVIFVDADQIVRTDMIELVNTDLHGAPYGFTPMCDSRTEMEGFRFWKQGYWARFLHGLPYHISALYVVDLHRFRQIAAGDRLRQQYHSLSADPNSLANLDQDLPNHMQSILPIHSLPQEWLWCETWCSDESLEKAKTIDLCNNPQTKEPKLDRARRQVPEWTEYDDEIAAVLRKSKGGDDGHDRAVKNPKSRALDTEKERTHVKDEL